MHKKNQAKPRRYNTMMDVAFTVVTTHEDWRAIPTAVLLRGLERRLAVLRESPQDAAEAFGFCDQYEVEA